MKKMNIAVAGLGYVGMGNAVVLSQHNRVKVVDMVCRPYGSEGD